MKMRGFVFLKASKAISFCELKENMKPQRGSDADSHFHAGVQRKTERSEVILGEVKSE